MVSSSFKGFRFETGNVLSAENAKGALKALFDFYKATETKERPERTAPEFVPLPFYRTMSRKRTAFTNKTQAVAVVLFLLTSLLPAQDQITDSLKLALKKATHDTTRCAILNALTEETPDDEWPLYNKEMYQLASKGVKNSPKASRQSTVFQYYLAASLNNEGVLASNADPRKAIGLFDQALSINRNINDTSGIIMSLNNKAAVLRTLGNIPEAIKCFEECRAMAYRIRNKDMEATTLFNLSVNHGDLGENTKAIEYLYQSMQLREELNDEPGKAKCLRSLAWFHTRQGNHAKSNELLLKSLEVFRKFKMPDEMGLTYNNLGTNYQDLHQDEKALSCFDEALKLFGQVGNLHGRAVVIHNKTDLYFKANKLQEALENEMQSLKIREELGDKEGIAASLHTIGQIYFTQRDLKAAYHAAQKSLTVAQQVGNPRFIRDAAYLMSDIYKKEGKYREALEMHELSIAMKDSLINQDIRKKNLQKEFQYQYAQKAAADSIRVAEEKKVTAAQLENEKTQRISLYSGLGLVTIFSLFMVNRFRVTHRQKKLIEVKEKEALAQKKIVEEKQKEIMDSIAYAQRLQQAILPSDSVISNCVSDYFLLYRPKDVVAGDFYFFERKEELVYMAAADCTGHGVPGAMVSVVCSNALNRSLNEFNIGIPGKILDKTSELVVETFAKSGNDVKDGMDISLCSLNIQSRLLTWSGANNPLWYIYNGELAEVKATKQPVGKTYDPKPFDTQEIVLQPGTAVYLITDGYADQFGGPKGKKYKYRQLQDLLLEIYPLPMDQQKQRLAESFDSWKGELEQVDDVTIIGIRV